MIEGKEIIIDDDDIEIKYEVVDDSKAKKIFKIIFSFIFACLGIASIVLSFMVDKEKLECIDGYTLNEEKLCVSNEEIDTTKLQCSLGKLIEDKKLCLVEKDKKCEEGFELQDNKCIKEEVKEKVDTKRCPKQTVKELSGKCLTKASGKVITNLICPKGSLKVTVEGAEKCFKNVKDLQAGDTCEGTEVSGKCYSNEVNKVKTFACSKGYTLYNNKCYESASKETVKICPRGYQEKDGKCNRKVEGKTLDICPEGFVEKENKCYKKAEIIKECRGEELKEISGKCYKIYNPKDEK